MFSFLNTACKEIPNTTICTFPPGSFLSEVSDSFYKKQWKNLAMLEKQILLGVSDQKKLYLIPHYNMYEVLLT